MENMEQEYFKQIGRRATFVGYDDNYEWEPSYVHWLEIILAGCQSLHPRLTCGREVELNANRFMFN